AGPAEDSEHAAAPEAAGKEPDSPVLNDVTVGAYSVAVETGPSYTTRREEAKASMVDLVKSAPQVFPLIGDLYARSQDWPLAAEIGERLELLLPPPIKAMLDAKKGPPQLSVPGPGPAPGEPGTAPPPGLSVPPGAPLSPGPMP